MASPGAAELSPALLKIATYVYRFPLPATRVISFTKCFADNLGADQTSKSISSMEQARDDLANELASGTPNYAQAVAGATRYCPLISHVLVSLEKSKDVVYLNEPLAFAWMTGLGERPRQDWVTNQAVVWDKCMVLAAQALSYADTVYNMLEDSAGSKFTEAGVHLRTAAGIFERLHKAELPRWVGDTAEAPRLVEAEPGICEGLVQFCLAEAQQMAIGKALVAGNTPKTLLARLCEGVRKLLEDCVSAMRRGASSAYSKLDSPFLVHITFQQCIFRGMAYRFLAENAWAKDQYGVGLAYMVQACKYVEERRDTVSVGLPPLAGPLRSINQDLRTLQGEFRGLRDSYAKENNSIFYESVPEVDMLDPLPQPVVMMKPLPSEAAALPAEILSFKATGSGSSDGEPAKATGSGGDGGGGDGGDNGKKTDEELARELHDKLNT
ncbi:unnamed protein product [Pylaiella littoralis]